MDKLSYKDNNYHHHFNSNSIELFQIASHSHSQYKCGAESKRWRRRRDLKIIFQ